MLLLIAFNLREEELVSLAKGAIDELLGDRRLHGRAGTVEVQIGEGHVEHDMTGVIGVDHFEAAARGVDGESCHVCAQMNFTSSAASPRVAATSTPTTNSLHPWTSK